MATFLKQAIPDPSGAFAPTMQASVNQAQAQANAPVAPMYTPEQIAARKQANADAYQWGLLGAMMGDERQARVGGQILQQALANRQERVTDKGVFDPVTGEMRENTQYARERAQGALERAQERFGSAEFQHGESQGSQRFQSGENAKQRAAAIEAATVGFGRQKELENMRIGAENERARISAGAKGQNTTEDQGKSGGFALRMQQSKKIIDEIDKQALQGGSSGRMGAIKTGVGSFPLVGGYAQRLMTDESQQKYKNAQDDWLAANARAESGASIKPEEMETFRTIFFPMPGDSDELVAQKHDKREAAEAGMVTRAGPIAYSNALASYNASHGISDEAPPTLKISKEGATPARAPAAPTSMLPRTRAAMAGQDPFAPAAPLDYGG